MDNSLIGPTPKRRENGQTCMDPRKCLALLLVAALPAAAQQNPLARRGVQDLVSLGGYWNGANLENRSNCATPGVNGIHGTYAQYFFSVNPSSSTMQIHESTVTNLTCDYDGAYADDRFQPSWNGTFSCSDGKRGTFQARSFLISPTEMQVRLQLKFQNSEGCDADSILGGSRFY
jgi:hypothetical protein